MKNETKPCACCGRPVKSNLTQRCTGICVIDGHVICDRCFKRLRTNELLFENLVREDKRTRQRKVPTARKQCIENELRAFLEDLGYEVETYPMNGTLMMNAVKKGKDAVHLEFCDYATWMEG